MNTWREKARNCIVAAIEKAIDQELDIKQTIDNAYPFYKRNHYPYAVWLSERKKALEDLKSYHRKNATDLTRFACLYCRDREGGCLLCMKRRPKEGDVVLSRQSKSPSLYDVVLGGTEPA